jgi:hypothetical protein
MPFFKIYFYLLHLKPCLSADYTANSLFLIMLTFPATPGPYKNISHVKKIRSIKRLLSLPFKKIDESIVLPSLSICHQE